MTTRRAPGQKLMNLSVKEDFLATLDAALAEHSLGERSQFMRDAVREKVNDTLKKEVITKEMTQPPGHTGKGGRQVKYPSLAKRAPAAGDKLNSKPAGEQAGLLDVAEKSAARRRAKP